MVLCSTVSILTSVYVPLNLYYHLCSVFSYTVFVTMINLLHLCLDSTRGARLHCTLITIMLYVLHVYPLFGSTVNGLLSWFNHHILQSVILVLCQPVNESLE